MGKIYAYIRVSTKKQNIERQRRNVLAEYPTAEIFEEVFSARITSRPGFEKLLKKVRATDTIVFDSVSRMSRNAEEGFALYKKLYEENVNLVFLKERHINTETYKKALSNNLEMTSTAVDSILKGINEYLMTLAEEQIKLAFVQAEKEAEALSQSTKEGLRIAVLNGKRLGARPSQKLVTKKSIKAKIDILKHNKSFGGSLNDYETIRMTNIARNSFYKYKKELIQEINNNSTDISDISMKLKEKLKQIENVGNRN